MDQEFQDLLLLYSSDVGKISVDRMPFLLCPSDGQSNQMAFEILYT